MNCPRCQKEITGESSACASCGFSFDDATRRLDSPLSPPVMPSQTQRQSTSFDAIDDARFVPGTILAERYRIMGLLGRGGMGEVYRADDLKLGQPVALKFLSEQFASDSEALARLYREVRIARQVSHPNVCRVYDIGELEGQHFLSMEFIRGEELSSLLRRIGRLPAAKATEIARQICAGLAAAHNRGVLHRDLKPANVMIDEHGHARLTDFGIAALAEEIRGDEIRAGTPAYMSPEQLAGKDLTAKSDIYSLGLVLYELFTGKKAFSAPTLPALLDLRNSDSTPSTPSSLVKNIDPLVERVILRCIEKDPDGRPDSALQVAAALPGGDPLAAALAAGETPSPEAVAAAPTEGTLRPVRAFTCFALLLIGLTLSVLLADKTRLHRRVPLTKSPEVLQDRAREIISKFGYDKSVDSAYGMDVEDAYLRYLREHDSSAARWEKISSGQPAAILFWFRQSPRYLVPYSRVVVRADDPPETVSGMAKAELDMQGRLISFAGVPARNEQTVDPASVAGYDWRNLFVEADLDPSSFQPTAPRRLPDHYADTRAAWEGVSPGRPDIPIRVEAAAYRGEPVYFQIIYPWNNSTGQVDAQTGGQVRIVQTLAFVCILAVLFGGMLLALRNLRLGLGDRKGAFRLAVFLFVLNMISQWIIGGHHIPQLQVEFNIFIRHFAISLFYAGLLWSMYIALEPFVRGRWPHRIISWSRLLGGNFRDPLVGRDLLIGGLFGVALNLLYGVWTLAPKWLGRAPDLSSTVTGLLGFRGFLQQFMLILTQDTLLTALALLLVLLLLSFVFRKDWLTALASWVLFTFALAATGHNLGIDIFFGGLIAAAIIFAAMRFGLLVSVFLFLFVSVSYELPMTSDFSVWYATNALFALVFLVALGAFGCYVSLGGAHAFQSRAVTRASLPH
jgi:serine/threonine protein kinase